MDENIMRVNLKVWRQADAKAQGGFVTYSDVETTPDTSFLETLDILNETLVAVSYTHLRAQRPY